MNASYRLIISLRLIYGYNMGILCKNFTSQKTFSYAKSVIKTPMRHQSNAIDIIVVSLLLNLEIFHTLF